MLRSTAEKLELLKIFEMLRKNCTSAVGRDMVREVRFSSDPSQIRRWQEETSEAAEILRLYPDIPIGGARDIREALKRANIGGTLEPADFLAISDTMRCARRLKNFFSNIEESFPHLKNYAGGIRPQLELEKKINKTITDEGEIFDSASPELLRIRRQISNLQTGIKDKLNNIIRSPELRKYLQEALITIREDRFVVPVKAENRSKIAGLIHDQSSSGATVFVEPYQVVQLNNELRRKKAEEKNEINRILRELSAEVSIRGADIEQTLYLLAKIDLVLAKGRLSLDMGGVPPKLNEEGYIYICRGRHPLIPKDEVVPVTVYLGKDFNILVITGPNTGGKTVTLKTIGLLTAMAQCGLHIPAEPGSEIAVFEQIFVDIGDEQSIEQSLSTFSSHMSNIIGILPRVDEKTLVLLDELGAGTDPTEGSALAMAILEYLLQKQCRCVATTHYSELKTYAYVTPEIENASVEFDPKTLRPTFRLLIGVPGKSNAIDIASRLGLNGRIVQRAREFLTTEEVQVSDLIQGLEENKRISYLERKKAEQLRHETQEAKAKIEQKLADLEKREKDILSRANREARKIVRQAQKQAKELLENLKTKLSEEAEKAQLRAEQEVQEKLRQLEKSLAEDASILEKPLPGEIPHSLRPGEKVYILKLNQAGTVLSEPNPQGEVQVQVGPMKINVKVSDLRINSASDGSKKAADEKVTKASILVPKSGEISSQIDLRGLTLEEAVRQVDKYLDDACLVGLKEVTLIHGKGTGALRKGLREFLKEHPQVADFRLGGQGEGGLGVTVVKLL